MVHLIIVTHYFLTEEKDETIQETLARIKAEHPQTEVKAYQLSEEGTSILKKASSMKGGSG